MMHRRTLIPAVLLLVPLALMCGLATQASSADLDKPISLDLKDADLRMVLDLYGDILDVQLQVDPAVNGTISITFNDISVRTSLNAICESAKCRWRMIDGDPAVLQIEAGAAARTVNDDGTDEEGPRPGIVGAIRTSETRERLDSLFVSFNLVEADAAAVLKLAAKLFKARLILEGDLKGQTLNVIAEEVLLSTFLDETCDQLNCGWKLIDGDPPTLSVYRR